MPSPQPAADTIPPPTDVISTDTPNSPQTCHPEAEFVAKPTNADEGPASKNSVADAGAGAPCLEETTDAGAPSFGAASSRERVGEETADAGVSEEHNARRRTLPLLSNEEIERRSQIILKHQDRLDKITQEYQNYPNLTEILTSAMDDILQEEGESA